MPGSAERKTFAMSPVRLSPLQRGTAFGTVCARRKEISVFGLGLPELAVVLVIALLVFGPARLPAAGKGIGEAIRGFKDALKDGKEKEKREIDKE